jgi:adenylate cyclase
MNWRELLPNIRYGTERYPEKVARRLRAVNITTWAAASFAATFAIMQVIDGRSGLGQVAAINAFDAVMWASLPLLHRFGPRIAAVVLALTIYTSHLIVISLLGAATGMAMHYMVAIALVALFFGTEGAWLSAALAVLAFACIAAIEIFIPRNAGLVPDSMLQANFFVGVSAVCAVLYWVVYSMMRQTERAEATAERERQRSDALLANILPPKVAARLKANDRIADRYGAASVLFADMAGFTARASDTEPDQLVGFLDDVFGRIDALVERHGLEKIKTTGDAYMVVAGVPEPRPDHAGALAALALDMRDALADLVDPKGRPVPIRIGIASGPGVAGVVGRAKFFYDVWGDAVNTAARMEQTAEPGTIQVAPEMRELLTERFELQERGLVDVRGKGEMRTWLLVGRKH